MRWQWACQLLTRLREQELQGRFRPFSTAPGLRGLGCPGSFEGVEGTNWTVDISRGQRGGPERVAKPSAFGHFDMARLGTYCCSSWGSQVLRFLKNVSQCTLSYRANRVTVVYRSTLEGSRTRRCFAEIASRMRLHPGPATLDPNPRGQGSGVSKTNPSLVRDQERAEHSRSVWAPEMETARRAWRRSHVARDVRSWRNGGNVVTYSSAILACHWGEQWQSALELLRTLQKDRLQGAETDGRIGWTETHATSGWAGRSQSLLVAVRLT